jgi:hypothetical protein
MSSWCSGKARVESLPILSLNSQGRIRIEVPQHVKLVLR